MSGVRLATTECEVIFRYYLRIHILSAYNIDGHSKINRSMKESGNMKVKVLKPIFADSASQLVNTVGNHKETVLLKKGHWVVDAKSILGVLALSLQPGQEVEVTLSNGENQKLMDDLLATGLFEKK